ncbi:hypothetical protein CS8_037140 [Cupriavidus sp. 8B]
MTTRRVTKHQHANARLAADWTMHHSVAARVVAPAPFLISSLATLFTIPMVLATLVAPVAALPVPTAFPAAIGHPYAAAQGSYDQDQKHIPSPFHGTLLVERSDRRSHCLESRTPDAGLCGRVMGASQGVTL